MFLGQEELQTLLSQDRSKQMSLIKDGVNNEATKFWNKYCRCKNKKS